MKTDRFNYDLPEHFIAQEPVSPRDHSRLLVFDSSSDLVEHHVFRDILDYLRPDDVLVVNNSKVIPARLLFSFEGKELEIFVLSGSDFDVDFPKKEPSFRSLLADFKGGASKVVTAMVRPGKFFKEGACFDLGEGVSCEVLRINEDGTRVFTFEGDYLKLGRTPLPPYIDNPEIDSGSYQTVYADKEGSVAAPTAGLHFTPELLEAINAKGVNVCDVTLHVGRGTFLPVKTDSITDHKMHEEFYTIGKEACDLLNGAKLNGGRIICVGTTSVRVLESVFDGEFRPKSGSTDIFIYPGYEWKAVDALITNFHLPKSTLLMLVSSFLEGKGVDNSVEKLLDLYDIAKNRGYRFYSFGDAMFLF